MNLILFLLIGLFAGWLARQFMGGRGSWFRDLCLGVIGSFVGGLLFGFLGIAAENMIGELLCATAGAIATIFVIRKLA